jgi:hypothetical protein
VCRRQGHSPRVVASSSPPVGKPAVRTSDMAAGSPCGSGRSGIERQNCSSSTLSTAMSTSYPTHTTCATYFWCSLARRTCRQRGR